MMYEIKTARGKLHYNIESPGGVLMGNAQTVDQYKELINRLISLNTDDFGVFWAFNDNQMEEGIKRIKAHGFYRDDEDLCQAGDGLIGTASCLDTYYNAMRSIKNQIRAECDPQECYFYEFNNNGAPTIV